MLSTHIRNTFRNIIEEPAVHIAKRELLDVVRKQGLGAALLILHQRALDSEHIPSSQQYGHTVTFPNLPPDPSEKYVFAHVPVRKIRTNPNELVRLGIMNDMPDPNRLVYHEDALVGTFTFNLTDVRAVCPNIKPQEVIADLLTVLESQQLLQQVQLNSWQVQFKDQEAAQRIRRGVEAFAQRVYVRTSKQFVPSAVWLPSEYDQPNIRKILDKALKYKAPCNYCGVRELNPKEDIISTSFVEDWKVRYKFEMTRSYEFGFTFAPFGDPERVCHFLAWDNPSVSEVVNNMDLQEYSFGDLVRLTKAINSDIQAYCKLEHLPFEPIIGVCNHWAGNSIYHQHYQFCRIERLPLFAASPYREQLLSYSQAGLTVERLFWESPIYRINMTRASKVEDLCTLADSIAQAWKSLSAPNSRVLIGNDIAIDDNTQNIAVSYADEVLTAYFIPRLRSRVATQPIVCGVKKQNLGVMEMLGYFLLDEAQEMEAIKQVDVQQRNLLGEGALRDVAPDEESIRLLETRIRQDLAWDVIEARKRLEVLGVQDSLSQIEESIREVLRVVNNVICNRRDSTMRATLEKANTAYAMLSGKRNKMAKRHSGQQQVLFSTQELDHLCAP